MKIVQHISEALTAFTFVALLSHMGTAYAAFRGGMLMLMLIGFVAILSYGLVLIAKSLMDQRQSESSEQSVMVAILCAIPAFVLMLLFVFGGFTGVFTAWQ